MIREALRPHITYAPDATPTETANPERKKQFSNTHLFITGAEVGIGGDISQFLLEKGASITGIHRDPRKAKRETPLQEIAQANGTTIDFAIADLATDKGVMDASHAMLAVRDKLDVVILNASDRSKELNVTANTQLSKLLINIAETEKAHTGKAKKRDLVLMQSGPGHFAPQARAVALKDYFYLPIADAKFEGEQSITSLTEKLAQNNIRLLIVTPPGVPDSPNLRMFNGRKDRGGAMDTQFEFSRHLGLPEAVMMRDVSQRIATLLQSDAPHGWVELFGDMQDARFLLSPWYDTDSSFIDTINLQEKFAKMIAIPEYCRGHFNQRVGKLVVPGHVLEEAGSQTLGISLINEVQGDIVPILQERHGAFEKPTRPGDILTLSVTDYEIKKRDASGAVKITNQNDETIGTVTTKLALIPAKIA